MTIKIILKEFTTTPTVNTSLFEKWLESLKGMEAAKVTKALYQLEHGNFSNVKSVGEGVFEYKINYGPGYRVYFGQDGDILIILLCGGTKRRQREDISKAKLFWKEYKQRKKLTKGDVSCH